MRALPEQFRAAIVALQAHVRVEEEDGRARGFDVSLNESWIQIQLPQHVPHRLVHGQAMRILLERGEEIFKGLGVTIARGEVTPKRESCPPILRVGRDQSQASLGEALRLPLLFVKPFEPLERQVGTVG